MRKKKEQPKTKITKFPYFNQGVCHTCVITSPYETPVYKLKEIFDKNFVGKGTKIQYNEGIFSSLNSTYEVI